MASDFRQLTHIKYTIIPNDSDCLAGNACSDILEKFPNTQESVTTAASLERIPRIRSRNSDSTIR
jgi:hypothetical protein